MPSVTLSLSAADAPNYAAAAVAEGSFVGGSAGQNLRSEIHINTSGPSPIYGGVILGVFFDLLSAPNSASDSMLVYDSAKSLISGKAGNIDTMLPWLLPTRGQGNINMLGVDEAFNNPTNLEFLVKNQDPSSGFLTSANVIA